MAAYFGFRHRTCIYNENYLSRKFVLYRGHFHLPEFFSTFPTIFKFNEYKGILRFLTFSQKISRKNKNK